MLILKNRKAFHEGVLLEKFTTGISLHGYEVKAIRESLANFEGAFVQLIAGELWVVNMYVGQYSKQSQKVSDHEMRRTRKLLVTKSELERIRRLTQEKGRMCLPLALVLEHNLIKLEVGVMKGMKKVEKKGVAKERQIKRDLEIATKNLKHATDF